MFTMDCLALEVIIMMMVVGAGAFIGYFYD